MRAGNTQLTRPAARSSSQQWIAPDRPAWNLEPSRFAFFVNQGAGSAQLARASPGNSGGP